MRRGAQRTELHTRFRVSEFRKVEATHVCPAVLLFETRGFVTHIVPLTVILQD
jgi:hypothetical protein